MIALSNHLLRLAIACLAIPVGATAQSQLREEGQRLLIAERFDEVEAKATAALAAAKGETPTALRHRLQALDLLVDMAKGRHSFQEAATLEWIREGAASAAALYPERDKKRAKWLALEGLYRLGQGLDPASRDRGTSLLKQATELLSDGSGTIDRFDESSVLELATTASIWTRNYDQGLQPALRAEAITRNACTPWELRRRGMVLASLGLMQAINGQVALALDNARAGAALVVKTSGRDSLAYADNVSRLGQVYTYADNYAGVRDSLQAAIDIFRRRPWLGVKSADRAANSLGHALRRLGDYAHARALFEEVIAHNEVDAQGHFDEMLPDSLNTLAGLENETGNVDRARQLYERALDLEDRLYGAIHPLYLEKPLINLGNVAVQQEDLAAAERYFQRAAELDATDHSGLLTNYLTEGQADLALAQGRADRAEALFAASIEQTQRRYGVQHRLMVERYCDSALAKARLGKKSEAFESAFSAERLRIDLLRGIAPALSEEHALNFKSQLRSCSGMLLALSANAADASLRQRAWQLIAESRGLTTRLQGARIAVARSAADAAGKERWSRWENAARVYAEVMLRNVASRTDIDAAHDALDRAERDLGDASLAAAGLAKAPSLGALLANEREHVVVAYSVARHAMIDAHARGQRWQGRDLFALVSAGGSQRLVGLGNIDAIDMAIDRWLKQLRNPASDAAALAAAGNALRMLIWDPLGIAADNPRVLVVPDGALFRVNFAVLPDAAGGYLVERGWRFHLLDNEQDLAAPADAAAPDRLLVLGAPDFGVMPAPSSTQRSCGAGFAALDGAAAEVRDLARAWREAPGTAVKLLIDRAASKPAVEEAAAHFSVLHFATHALDIGADCEAVASSRGVTLDAMSAPALARTHSAALALAGANRLFTEGSPDGILTSAEAATLPLQQARWVVLAACDTGLGEVVADEGVFGLRRGFRLAGAHTVLMSLWRVDDAASAEFMQSLYAARWQAHVDTPQALASAEHSTLNARRERGESTHPYYWAAFVASGDWR